MKASVVTNSRSVRVELPQSVVMSRDLSWSFAPLHIVAKFVGVLPLEGCGAGLHQWLIVVFWTILTTYTFVLAVQEDMNGNYRSFSVTLVISDVIAMLSCLFSAISCYAATIRPRRDTYNLAKNLLNIITKDIIVDERRYFSIRVTIAVALVAVFGPLAFGYWQTVTISVERYNYKLIFFIISNMSSSVSVVLFCMIFSALKNSFHDLNSHILSVFDAISETNLNHLLLGILTAKNLTPSEGKSIALPKTLFARSHAMENKIQYLRRYHLVLHDIGTLMEHYFSVSVLVALGKSFIALVRCGYSVLTIEPNDIYVGIIINSLLWSSIESVKMFSICWICDAVTSESSKTGNILAKLAALHPQGFSAQLDAFLTQATVAYKRKNVIAGGFLSINKALVFSIISATATYLIIISQFL